MSRSGRRLGNYPRANVPTEFATRHRQLDAEGACRGANVNILRIGAWNMCKNMEWMYCAAKGKLARGTGRSGPFIFSPAPKELNLDPFYRKGGTGTPQGDGKYTENDIFYLVRGGEPRGTPAPTLTRSIRSAGDLRVE